MGRRGGSDGRWIVSGVKGIVDTSWYHGDVYTSLGIVV